MSNIFTPYAHGKFSAKNRIVRSATWLATGDENGYPTEKSVEIYRKLAEGGCGSVVVELTHIRRVEKGVEEIPFAKYFCFADDEAIPYFAKVVDTLKKENVQVIDQQAVHSFRKIAADGTRYDETVDGLTKDDINEIIKCHADAAVRAKKRGFDGVQIHCAHGFLVCRFLSRYYNHRDDEYGADRAKILFDIYDAVRRATGPDFQIWIKINEKEFVPADLFYDRGVEGESVADVCIRLGNYGYDAIETSGQEASRPSVRRGKNEAYFLDTALKIKNNSDTNVILCGGLRSIDTIEKINGENGIELFSMSRPLISEPDLPEKWKNGVCRTARCVSCNRCYDIYSCILDTKKKKMTD